VCFILSTGLNRIERDPGYSRTMQDPVRLKTGRTEISAAVERIEQPSLIQ